MISIGPLDTTLPNLVRLLFIPVLTWAAWRDYQTRRVPNITWLPLIVVSLSLYGHDLLTAWYAGFPTYTTIQLVFGGLFLPVLAVGLWAGNLFGGADVKAIIVLGFGFATYPTYYLPTVAVPIVTPTLGIFAFTVFTNAAVIGAVYPVVLSLNNIIQHSPPRLAAYTARHRETASLADLHGRLIEQDTQNGRQGLDLDVLRMYLQWRGITLPELQTNPEQYRTTTPNNPNKPGNGLVTDGGHTPQQTTKTDTDSRRTPDATHDDGEVENRTEEDDPWAVDAFLADTEVTYGMDAATIRRGLNTITTEETVWVSPGLPFFIPLTIGFIISLTYGDLAITVFSTVL
ncbi:A24 family peptidase [Salinibaculum rarum]|uniref:A24 family peptidase n=1 Tax=Salinibaculum rarum TaxID=3058903 RepID=UPI00265E8843|nr:A24 family peptidase [Salinibaculum sp. KK48]